MTRLSPQTAALVDEAIRLANERAWPWRRRQAVAAVVEQLDAIAAAGEWLAVPRIISLTLHKRRPIAEAASRAVGRLRSQLRVYDYARLDPVFRALSPYARREYMPWRSMEPKQLAIVAALESGAAVLQFAMCHPSGFVREAAIRRCATSSDGRELPFLLLRCNDWVAAVRAAARTAVQARLRSEHICEVVGALPLVDRMDRWGRTGRLQVLDEIEATLRDASAVAPLADALSSPDAFVRRGAYRRLAGNPHASEAELFAGALNDADPAIRMWAGRALADASAEAFGVYFDTLVHSSLGAIRVRAVERAVAEGLPVPWPQLLFDAHSRVRSAGQQAAMRAGEDPADIYRRALDASSGRRLGAAVLGFSETSAAADALALVRSFLGHETPCVRRSALHAMANLKAHDLGELALLALSDDSPSVTHVARDILQRRETGYVSPTDVWAAFEAASTTWGKRDAVAVLANHDFWEKLPYLLYASSAADDQVARRARASLDHWVLRQSRVFTTPSVSTLGSIRAALDELTVPCAIAAEIRAALDSRAT